MTKLIQSNFEELLEKFKTHKIKRKSYIDEKNKLDIKLKDKENRLLECETAILILKDYLGVATDEVVHLFEETVTSGLKRIFNEEYDFKIRIDQHKNKKGCTFLVHTDEYDGYIDIDNSQGTCLEQVVSMICRVIMVSLDPEVHKTIILDEPFSGAAVDKIDKIVEFMYEISENFGIQLIVISHMQEFVDYADKVITL